MLDSHGILAYLIIVSETCALFFLFQDKLVAQTISLLAIEQIEVDKVLLVGLQRTGELANLAADGLALSVVGKSLGT